MTEPKVSVIITAHGNRPYILDCIESVINQTIPQCYYEIIIVRDFKDDDLESLIKKYSLVDLLVEDGPVGKKIMRGIEISKGNIISFLEDDDKFFTDKLKEIIEIFKDKKVGLYHNSSVWIDKEDNILDRSVFKWTDPKRKILYQGSNDISDILRLTRYGALNQMSCMSIRKNIIANALPTIGKIELIPDLFTFFLAVKSGYHIVVDNKILTCYRSHESLSSPLSSNRRDTLTKVKRYNEASFLEIRVNLKELMKNHPSEVIIDILSIRIKMMMCILGQNSMKLGKFDYLRILTTSLKLLKFPIELKIIILYSLSFINSTLSSEIYLSLR